MALVNTTAMGAVKGARVVDVLKKRRSIPFQGRPGESQSLMVRRRVSAVSNHEAPDRLHPSRRLLRKLLRMRG
jgi:hypothetical protein